MRLLNMRILPLEAAHAYAVYGLPMLNRDPFDRMLIAQAMSEDLTLVTSDQQIHQYAVKWIW
jgi:PIN domain nuclease of toxin-antitoxin system